MDSEKLTLNKTDANLTPSAVKSSWGVNPKCTDGANPKCMGATVKEAPPHQRSKDRCWQGDFFDPVGIKP